MGSVYDPVWIPVQTKRVVREQIWTIVAESFNAKPNMIRKGKLGLFRVHELETAEGILPLTEHYISHLKELLDFMDDRNRCTAVWETVEEYCNHYEDIYSKLKALYDLHPDENYKDHAREALNMLQEYQNEFWNNVSLYPIVKRNGKPEDDIEKAVYRCVEMEYERNGGSLHHDQEYLQDKIKALQTEIRELNHEYLEGCSKPITVDPEDVPERVRNEIPKTYDMITATEPYTYSDSEKLRECGYRIFYGWDEEQANILIAILSAKTKLAHFTGHLDYRTRMMKNSILSSAARVIEFIQLLSAGISDYAREDLEHMTILYKKFYPAKSSEFSVSDYMYMIRYTQHLISEELVENYSQYLSLGACLEGIDKILQNQFFMKIEPGATCQGEIWTPNLMYKAEVSHNFYGSLGFIAFDLFSRPGKPEGTTHYVVKQGGFHADDEYIQNTFWHPYVVILSMNIDHTDFLKPTFLTIDEAESLFTEFGRMLPLFLVRHKHQFMLRTHCPVDFSEVLALIMQHFFYDPKIMPTVFRDYPKSNVLPEEVLNRIRLSRKVFKAIQLQQAILRCAIDRSCHTVKPKTSNDLLDLFTSSEEQYSHILSFPNTAPYLKEQFLVDGKWSGGMVTHKLIPMAVAAHLWKINFQRDPYKCFEFTQLVFKCFETPDSKACYTLLLGSQIRPADLVKLIVTDIEESRAECREVLENLLDF